MLQIAANRHDRRKFLKLAAGVLGGSAALAAAGCAEVTNPTTGVTTLQIDPQVMTYIQDAVSAATAILPSATSVANVIATLVPGIGQVLSIAESVVGEAISVITAAINAAAPVASARLRAAAPGGDVL